MPPSGPASLGTCSGRDEPPEGSGLDPGPKGCRELRYLLKGSRADSLALENSVNAAV